jgi:hypothetical protein
MMSIDLPVALDGEAGANAAETKSAPAWIEPALTALFAAASVLLISFVAVLQAIA